MNERIKELIKQATTIEEHKWGVSYDNFDKEKFAKLIVKEMLNTCEDHPAWTGRWIGEHIKQHFGVEE